MASKRAWRLERKRTAPTSKWWPWSFCCYGIGWESRWCLLDLITKCKVRWICNHHDKVVTGYDTEALATMPPLPPEKSGFLWTLNSTTASSSTYTSSSEETP